MESTRGKGELRCLGGESIDDVRVAVTLINSAVWRKRESERIAKVKEERKK